MAISRKSKMATKIQDGHQLLRNTNRHFEGVCEVAQGGKIILKGGNIIVKKTPRTISHPTQVMVDELHWVWLIWAVII